jgi:ABC-type protease/lipase transport system fused ATPase/permease subunit
LSIHLTKILSAVKEGQQKYCETVYSRSGINHMWILKNSKDLLDNLKLNTVRMQDDATVAPICIDIIYILHVYLSLCVITIYCKCVSTNKYCLLSIVYKKKNQQQQKTNNLSRKKPGYKKSLSFIRHTPCYLYL